MNPTDPAFPIPPPNESQQTSKPGMDLRTYMAMHLLAAFIANRPWADFKEPHDPTIDAAVKQAEALIARLNAK